MILKIVSVPSSSPGSIFYTMGGSAEFDKRLIGWVNNIKAQSRAGLHVPSEFVSLDYILHDMRLYKSREELRLMRKAAAINVRAWEIAVQQMRTAG